MPIAYYRPGKLQPGAAQFWTDHWGSNDLSLLVAQARNSPLTRMLDRHIPHGGKTLEAGCGLGQFVIHFREMGRDIEGVDFSEEAVATAIEFAPGTPVRHGDVRSLPYPDSTFDCYVSLGVIEHFVDGPEEILREALRVLKPGGTALISVPYANGARQLFRPLINREMSRVRESGGSFYQYAYSKREFSSLLADAGLQARSLEPYDPGRLARQVLRRALSVFRGGAHVTTGGGDASTGPARVERSRFAGLLYRSPFRQFLSHMVLAVASKPAR